MAEAAGAADAMGLSGLGALGGLAGFGAGEQTPYSPAPRPRRRTTTPSAQDAARRTLAAMHALADARAAVVLVVWCQFWEGSVLHQRGVSLLSCVARRGRGAAVRRRAAGRRRRGLDGELGRAAEAYAAAQRRRAGPRPTRSGSRRASCWAASASSGSAAACSASSRTA